MAKKDLVPFKCRISLIPSPTRKKARSLPIGPVDFLVKTGGATLRILGL